MTVKIQPQTWPDLYALQHRIVELVDRSQVGLDTSGGGVPAVLVPDWVAERLLRQEAIESPQPGSEVLVPATERAQPSPAAEPAPVAPATEPPAPPFVVAPEVPEVVEVPVPAPPAKTPTPKPAASKTKGKAAG